MEFNVKKIIKYIAIVLSIILLVVLCVLLVRLKYVTEEQMQIQPAIKIELPKIKVPEPTIIRPEIKKNVIQEEIEKEVQPLMRDENDMPKSDFNVPEIG